MNEGRRNFVTKTALIGAISTVGVIGAQASASGTKSAHGVVKGKSPKKEITYTKTANWDEYYKTAL